MKVLGEDKFLREILYLCPHKKSMSYYETMEQFKRDVILREDATLSKTSLLVR